MAKKVIIEILLVPESFNKKSEKIENEILKDFNEGFFRIPWGYEIEKVTVVDAKRFSSKTRLNLSY